MSEAWKIQAGIAAKVASLFGILYVIQGLASKSWEGVALGAAIIVLFNLLKKGVERL